MSDLELLDLLKALQVLERRLSVALMYSGLRIAQFRLLEALDAAGQATVTEMSRRLRITRASASVMVNELIAAGMLVSDEHPSDRRSFHVSLSDLGRHKLGVARKDVAAVEDKIARRHSAEEIALLNAFAHTQLQG